MVALQRDESHKPGAAAGRLPVISVGAWQGAQVHDANIVATMQVYGICQLLTTRTSRPISENGAALVCVYHGRCDARAQALRRGDGTDRGSGNGDLWALLSLTGRRICGLVSLEGAHPAPSGLPPRAVRVHGDTFWLPQAEAALAQIDHLPRWHFNPSAGTRNHYTPRRHRVNYVGRHQALRRPKLITAVVPSWMTSTSDMLHAAVLRSPYAQPASGPSTALPPEAYWCDRHLTGADIAGSCWISHAAMR